MYFPRTKMDLFSRRGELDLPRTIQKSDLEHLSFYAFWRQFYFDKKKLHRRMKEQFISVSGTGFPAQAHREHAQHSFYARQTLYAYAPCPKLFGLEYLDVMVKHEYNGSWPAALRAFVEDPLNKWCPPWIRNNYHILNEDASDDDAEKRPGNETNPDTKEHSNQDKLERFPHENSKNIKKLKFVFEEIRKN